MALTALSLSMLLASLATSIASVALPTLARSFDASFQAVQWVVVAYLVATTVLVVFAGQLGDRLGRRRLLVAGLAIFTGASALCAAAPTLALLIAARALQGVGGAILMSLTLAFVADTVPKERIGRAMGLLGTMSAVGTALGPSLGGFLIAASGWRAIFLVNVPLGLAAIALAWRFLGDSPLKGTVPHKGQAPTGDRPLQAMATSFLVATVMMATLIVGPFYLSRALGLGAAMVGLVVTVGPAVVALTGVPAGRLADRYGVQLMSRVGIVAIAAGSALLAMTSPSLGIPGYMAPLVVITAGYAIFQTANNSAVMANVPASRRGAISGMLTLARNLGLVAGASAMGAVFAWGSGAADVATAGNDAVTTGLHATFTVAVILATVALVFATMPRFSSPSSPINDFSRD